MMTILEKITFYQRVWKALVPHLPTPTPQDAARWCAYTEQAVEAAILRTAKRFAQPKLAEGFDPHAAYKYTTSTARAISQRYAVLATAQENGAPEK
jgi:hypothetical protein